jgi:phospholipid/cholesterol/gamma-HCH transport system ATP-binding protein
MKTSSSFSESELVKTREDDIVVKIEHLKKSFGEKEVLADISFEIKKGENLAILGKSGTGKSVLIKCIVGLIQHDSGELYLFGENVSELKAKEVIKLRKRIGFLFQSGALYDSMSVRENLEFPINRQKDHKSSKEVESLILESLGDVGLSESIEKSTSELSGGMRKRLGLARTLILKPEIMLYDEPTTGLDPITSREISNLILDVQNRYNTSSIIITHDIECAKLTSNRIIILKEGVCFAEGSFDDLANSSDSWVQSFFQQEDNFKSKKDEKRNK